MQKATEHIGSASAEGSVEGLGSIVCDLICLIEHVRGSIAAIEAEIAREQLCSKAENAANVIVLDDVTRRYARGAARPERLPGQPVHGASHPRRQQGSARQSQRWC